jgi:hypothetical protein
MTARVIPFPRSRDHAFVARQANRMAELSQAAAEKHLAWQLELQASTMARRGIPADLIAPQVRALETAIRNELCRILMGGAA